MTEISTPTGQNPAVPAHLGRPIVGFLILGAKLAKLVLQGERKGVDKVVVRGLRLFAVRETLASVQPASGLPIHSRSPGLRTGWTRLCRASWPGLERRGHGTRLRRAVVSPAEGIHESTFPAA